MGNITTIQVQLSTKEKLVEIGAKDETYDDIILRLLKIRETAEQTPWINPNAVKESSKR